MMERLAISQYKPLFKCGEEKKGRAKENKTA
jgi:hypothetical protein